MIKQIIKIIWIVVAIAVFAHYVYLRILVDYYAYDPFMLKTDFAQDAVIISILAFPLSVIVPIIMLIFDIVVESDNTFVSPIINLIFLISGYFQWFLLLPWIWKKLGSKTIKGNSCNE